MVSTHLKNISQNGNLPQVGLKIKNVSNHHPDIHTLSVWDAGFYAEKITNLGVGNKMSLLLLAFYFDTWDKKSKLVDNDLVNI